MSENRELLGALGLCARAGKLIFGIPMICEALKAGGKNCPVLVMEAGGQVTSAFCSNNTVPVDASINTAEVQSSVIAEADPRDGTA